MATVSLGILTLEGIILSGLPSVGEDIVDLPVYNCVAHDTSFFKEHIVF